MTRATPRWCHCQSCRRHGGAPVSVFLAVRRDAFAVTKGDITRFNSSPGRWRGFCVRCGSTLTCEGEPNSPEVHLHIGSVDQAERFARKREPISTFLDAGMTAMLGSVIEMGGWGDERGVVRGS